MRPTRRLIVFTKPERPGRVKTRLIGELTAEQAAELHAAFRDDLLQRLAGAAFEIRIGWALEDGEKLPSGPVAGFEQRGADLGERLFNALAETTACDLVAVVGSDHPLLSAGEVERAFESLAAGADVVLGPALDGGYYLIGAHRGRVSRSIFEAIPWSTDLVLERTLERCSRLGLRTESLSMAADVDTPNDLHELCHLLAGDDSIDCPRTRRLLSGWGRLEMA